jgi:hypothetical protein
MIEYFLQSSLDFRLVFCREECAELGDIQEEMEESRCAVISGLEE